MKIYVASSWRNDYQRTVVERLRAEGHEVYDFKNPPNGTGFSWKQLDRPMPWDPQTYREVLEYQRAKDGFEADMQALRDCDACVLVLPCGRSAHLELGWACGARKKTIVFVRDERNVAGHSMRSVPCGICGDLDGCHLPTKPMFEPELMYKMLDAICISLDEIVATLKLMKQ